MKVDKKLLDVLRRISRQTALTWRNKEHELLWELSEKNNESAEKIGLAGLVNLIQTWNRRLKRSFDQEPPMVKVLTAFSSVLDVIYFLDETELKKFVQWAVGKGGDEGQFLSEAVTLAEGKDFSNGVENLKEVFAALIRAITNPSTALKPPLLTSEIINQLLDYIESNHDSKSIVRMLGGASGNMAYVLTNLGIDIAVHWPYHPEVLAKICQKPHFDRLTIDGEQAIVSTAGQGATYNDGGEHKPHPTRCSICVQYPEGLEIMSRPQIISKDTDRVIYRILEHQNDDRGWEEITLKNENESVHIKKPSEKLGDRGWPLFPMFGSWRVENKTLVFEVAGKEVMEKIGDDFDYVLLTGLQALDSELLDDKARAFIESELGKQLEVLKLKGTILHTEMGPTDTQKGMTAISRLIKKHIISVGLNHEELHKITSNKAYDAALQYPDAASLEALPSIYARCKRAKHLAAYLSLDELYVHGNDVDLILRKGVPRGAIWQEIGAALFAKGALFGALLLRSQPVDWYRILSEKVAPVLLSDGFIALFEFAAAISQEIFPHGDQTNQREKLFKHIVRSGYYYPKKYPDEYALMVVPVMWPKVSGNLSTAGAGDFTSGVVAVFTGK